MALNALSFSILVALGTGTFFNPEDCTVEERAGVVESVGCAASNASLSGILFARFLAALSSLFRFLTLLGILLEVLAVFFASAIL